MKKTLLKLTVPVLMALAVLAGCSNPTGGGGGGLPPEPVTYANTTVTGDKYELVINPDSASRAAVGGDSYVLTITFRNGQVKISTGKVKNAGGISFTLKPDNAGSDTDVFSITVNSGGGVGVIVSLAVEGTVTYKDDSPASATPPTMSADKKALNAAIEAAIADKTGVVTAAGAQDVPVGVQWVEEAYLTDLNTAIATAEGIAADASKTQADQAAVDAAASDLEAKRIAFNAAKRAGGKTDAPPVNRDELNDAIATAKAAKITEDTNVPVTTADHDTDANDRLVPGTEWVTPIVMNTFNTAIAVAEGIAADITKDQTAVNGAKDTLEAAITAFTTAKKAVPFVDKAALGQALIAAVAAKANVEESAVNGGDLSEEDVWVTPGVMTTFTGAIEAARTIDSTSISQTEVDGAVSALMTETTGAIAVFNNAKKTVGGIVTFDSGEGSAIPKQAVEKGGTVTRPDDPALAGFYLGGWYKDNPSALWDFDTDPVNGSITLRAVWLDGGQADNADFGGPATTTITVTDKAQWESALSGISGGGNYTIIVAGDIDGIAGSTTASFGGAATKVSLRGTGSLTLNPTGSNGSLITVGANQRLILRGPVLRGKDNNNVAVVTIEGSGAEFFMESGAVTGNTLNTPREGHDRGGSGVYVGSSAGTAAFTMNGGAISGNTINSGGGHNGGGVYVENDATFTMTGGTISGNTINSGKDGGGVAVGRDGEFTMSGGGSFTMSGGTISGNSTEGNGGGVSVESGAFTMSGGTISGNTANSDEGYGGGVNIEKEKETDPGSFTMSGGTISGNSALMGGGVGGPKGTFTMSGGTISSNTASYGGGVGIDNTGTFTMSNGTISGNTASYGGGVEVASIGAFTKTGGTIYGGTAGGNSNRALAAAANHPGHAVCVASIDGEVPSDENTTVLYYRDTTSGPGHSINTNDDISD